MLQGSGLPPPKPPELRERWMNKIADLVGGIPTKLPSFREVNHEIKLIDPGKRIIYCLPKCPDALKAELAKKDQLIYQRRMVGAYHSPTSSAHALRVKEKWQIAYGVRPPYAERQYGKGRLALS